VCAGGAGCKNLAETCRDPQQALLLGRATVVSRR
jgi:hypothetical protein